MYIIDIDIDIEMTRIRQLAELLKSMKQRKKPTWSRISKQRILPP